MEFRRNLCHCIATGTLVVASILLPFSEVQAKEQSFDQSMLRQVQEHYQLEEQQAIERLARESIAAETYQTIRTLGLKSYAGAWFDDKSMNLHVAISDESDSLPVKQAGATPVMVDYSLDQLKRIRQFAYAELKADEALAVDFRESYIDYGRNQVVIGVAPGQRQQAQALFSARGLNVGQIKVIETEHKVQPSSGPVRGGDGIWNRTWDVEFGYSPPCTIGAAVEGGFVTAGHCGWEGNVMAAPSDQDIGTIAGSNYYDGEVLGYSHKEDGAWVQTGPGWYPGPWINGYNDGLLLVPGLWAGMLESPVGAMVCRYGQTTGGPFCAPISEKHYDFMMWPGYPLEGFVRVNGICPSSGDSGGPIMSASGNQVQGTTSGGPATCSGNIYVVYQPIATTLSRFGAGSTWLRMLTLHGAAQPTINGFVCPDYDSSGQGTYVCKFSNYSSQGKTDVFWSTNTGQSSQSTVLWGNCSSGQSVNVNLAVSNPYGTRNQPASFPCPMGPIQ